MSTPPAVHRRATLLLAVLCGIAVALATGVSPVAAVPTDPGTDGTLDAKRAQLTTAVTAYVEAKAKLDASRGRQLALADKLRLSELRLTLLDAEVGGVAAAAYRGNRTNVTLALLGTDSPNALLHSAATVQYLARRDDREIHNLLAARADYAKQRTDLDAEVALAEQQLAEMAKRKADLERALGNPASSPGYPGGKATANPAPRGPNGAWPAESCSIKDPTNPAGCVTARLLNAYQQARAAGFTHYTHCFSPGSFGEHHLGRACDFAANATGFANVRASGADKDYGDRLAGWLLANADRLAVLYVIWYKQFWSPATGWKAYTAGDGTVAGDHYNHVHLSVY